MAEMQDLFRPLYVDCNINYDLDGDTDERALLLPRQQTRVDDVAFLAFTEQLMCEQLELANIIGKM
jgi:hypothetical protein